MLHHDVNGYAMRFVEVGDGPPLVCIHGSLGDFRVWSPVLGLLSRRHRVIAPSLRRFFPEAWDGTGDDFTIAQHVADTIAFLRAVGSRVHLLGHSRGGHIAFRVAQQRPDLLRGLVLAEPGGDLDASLLPPAADPSAAAASPARRRHVAIAAGKIAAGDIDGGLEAFVDAIDGARTWSRLAAATKQELRDNARTLLGQVNEQRQPYHLDDAQQIRVPTLLVGGEQTSGTIAAILRSLAAHVPNARLAMIPNATHMMFRQAPVRFSTAVLDFLAANGSDG